MNTNDKTYRSTANRSSSRDSQSAYFKETPAHQSSLDEKKTLEDLLDIIEALRSPKTGCPWDLQQDFTSIASYTIEEAFEVADAVSRDDFLDLCDELGDLFFQVIYHAQLAKERDLFDFSDVINKISLKMIRRHPHVFGNQKIDSLSELTDNWNAIKQQESEQKSSFKKDSSSNSKIQTPSSSNSKILHDIPAGMPALGRAIKIQNKAATVGFDWPCLDPVLVKAREEFSELEQSIESGNKKAIQDELGDLFFALSNVARHLNIDPETALRQSNQKFIRRFTYIENSLEEREKTPKQADLSEMEALWKEAKALERE